MTIASIYQTCKWVLDGLSLVPDFDLMMMMNNNNSTNKNIDHITINNGSHDDQDIFSFLTSSLSAAITDNGNSNNALSYQQQGCYINNYSNPSHIPAPLYQLWELCRQGYILCSLFNLLKPEAAIDLTLEQDTCKKQHKVFVYRFIIACRKHLSLNEDDLFTVSEMYQDNAMGFSKVINTLHRILTLLSERGILKSEYPPLSSFSSATTEQQHTSSSSISDNNGSSFRDKVIIELLHTERKYVEYLETTQKYAQELRSKQRNMISLDTLHHIFGNLNALIDFQLRFLMQVEYHAEHPKENFGRVLIELEGAFSVYEPYCANMQHALDLVVQWAPQLSTNNNNNGNNDATSTAAATSSSSSAMTAGTPMMNPNTVVEPSYELPSLLIKPVQRVCKYPLLLQQLMNYTSDDWPHYDDLQRGLEAMERVASKVNETRRLQENKQRVKELKERILDWKSITNVEEQCGALLLYDRAIVHHKNTTKEVSIHLFEKVIMLCADIASKKAKKKKDQNNSSPLSVLGLIKINNVAQVDQGAVPLSLQIFWLKDSDLESFTLEYRNDEQVTQWDSAVGKLIRQQTRSKRLSSLVTYGLESYHDREDATAALSPTFLSYAFMNKLPVRGGYYNQIPELLENNHDNAIRNHHDTMTSSQPSLYSYYTSHRKTNPDHQVLQHHQHSSANNYTNNSNNTAKSIISNDQSYYDSSFHYRQQQQHLLLQQPGTLPSPRSPSCSTPFSSSTSRSSSTNGLPSPPQSGSSPTSPCVQTVYELPPNGCGVGDEQQREQREQRRITAGHQPQQVIQQVTVTRGRSQSSPNIRVTDHTHSRTNTYNNNTSNPHYYLSTTSSQHIIRKATTVKVKLYYSRQSAFVFYAPRDINYQDLRTLAERKTRMKELAGDFIKYRDEDGDFITIHCDEDIIMAFDSAPRSDDAIHLFISTTPTAAVEAAVEAAV